MDEEEEEDIYAPDETGLPDSNSGAPVATTQATQSDASESIEEDDSDSDIDIITERTDEPRKDVQLFRGNSPKVNQSINLILGSSESASATKLVPVSTKRESDIKEIPTRLGSSYSAIKTSQLDLETIPTYDANDKPITEVNLDDDFPKDEKPWRKPGTDMTDFFNYGFDEFTWASYCLKQQTLRKEVTDSKQQMDEMHNFLNSGIPSMPALPPNLPSAQVGGMMGQMPGMGDVPPEMQQMFGSMMASGMDPSQMDPAIFMQMMSGPGPQMMDPAAGNFGQQAFNNQAGQPQMGQRFGGQTGSRNVRGRGGRW